MFSGPAHAEHSRPSYPLNHRRYSQSSNALPSFPLPNGPIHHISPTSPETVLSERRHNGPLDATTPRSEFRPRAQNLPRLQDILISPGPSTTPRHSSYHDPWSAPAAGPRKDSLGSDGYFTHTGQPHPSHVYPPPPPPEQHHPYSSHPVRRAERPALDIGASAREPSLAGPPSAPTARIENHYERPENQFQHNRHTSTTSYFTGGVRSPYTPASADDGHYRSPVVTFERLANNSSVAAAGAEARNKYLGVRDVPGEGTFHLYEGGYRIPTHVDGEQVNPAWGLTKANKPRKRLAMACLDCREKKIKCEPGVDSCLQCEKAKRPCRKAPAQQSHSDTASTPAWPNNESSPGQRDVSDSAPYQDRYPGSDPTNKRKAREETSPPYAPAKRRRSHSPTPTSNELQNVSGPSSDPDYRLSAKVSRIPSRSFAWEEDPYAVDAEVTAHVLNLYFTHANETLHPIFPRLHFMRWLETCTSKCQNERMILYAMMALGTCFAEDTFSGLRNKFLSIATDAIRSKFGRLNLSLVQTRLILGSFHFARGQNDMAWDFTGSAVGAARHLRYYTEQGCIEILDTAKRPRNEFDFTDEQLVECKRRTMWSVFLADRNHGSTLSLVDPKDITLKLPSSEDSYERGSTPNDGLLFNTARVGLLDPYFPVDANAISPNGWLVLVASIWGDVNNFVHRSIHIPRSQYRDAYEAFYHEIFTALQAWSSRLPENFRFNPTNFDHSLQGGYTGPFITAHVLHHFSLMRLNRFAQHHLINDSVPRRIQTARTHAYQLLEMISLVSSSIQQQQSQPQQSEQPSPSICAAGATAASASLTPFAGSAILAAIDIVSAGSIDSNIGQSLDLINRGLDSLRELSRFWSGAREQSQLCQNRYYQLNNILIHPVTARSGCWLGRKWGIAEPLERPFDLENDVIYGVASGVYYDAVKDDATAVTTTTTTNTNTNRSSGPAR